MTAQERARLREAIQLLLTDEGYAEAMAVLCRLAGIATPGLTTYAQAQPVPVEAVAPRPNTMFHPRPRRSPDAP